MTTHEQFEQRGADIVALLAASPAGLTLADLAATLHCTEAQVSTSIHWARRALADTDYNIVCDPPGYVGQWPYHLAATKAEAHEWNDNRMRDGKTRLVTIRAVAASIVVAAAPGSTEHREAVLIERSLTRLLEDLADIEV